MHLTTHKGLDLLYIENMKSIQEDPSLHVWTDACICANSWHNWHKVSTENTGGRLAISDGWQGIIDGRQGTPVAGRWPVTPSCGRWVSKDVLRVLGSILCPWISKLKGLFIIEFKMPLWKLRTAFLVQYVKKDTPCLCQRVTNIVH